MIIKNLKVTNFKSYKEITTDLRSLNVVIGANASGKSNFFKIFKFFTDLVKYNSINEVINNFNGVNNFKNLLQNEKFIQFEISGTLNVDSKNKNLGNFFYSIQLEYLITEKIIVITKESLKINYFEDNESKFFELNRDESGKIKSNQITFDFKHSSIPNIGSFLRIPFHEFIIIFNDQISRIQYYNFNISRAMQPSSLSEVLKKDLESDGSNLAVFLKNEILKNKKNTDRFNNLIKGILPYYKELNVESIFQNTYALNITETHKQDLKLYSMGISDGTISTILLISSLYFQNSVIVLIEEPESYLHPGLYHALSELIKDASDKKQIFITTHDPILASLFDVDDILLIQRDQAGFSTCTSPANKKQIKTFLDNELNIGDLMIDNLL